MFCWILASMMRLASEMLRKLLSPEHGHDARRLFGLQIESTDRKRMGILVALRLLHDSAIHFIFSLSFLHFFLVLLISHVFHFLTVCQKVKAENPNFSVFPGKNFLLLAEWEAEYINMLDSQLILPRSTNVPKRAHTRSSETSLMHRSNWLCCFVPCCILD